MSPRMSGNKRGAIFVALRRRSTCMRYYPNVEASMATIQDGNGQFAERAARERAPRKLATSIRLHVIPADVNRKIQAAVG